MVVLGVQPLGTTEGRNRLKNQIWWVAKASRNKQSVHNLRESDRQFGLERASSPEGCSICHSWVLTPHLLPWSQNDHTSNHFHPKPSLSRSPLLLEVERTGSTMFPACYFQVGLFCLQNRGSCTEWGLLLQFTQ